MLLYRAVRGAENAFTLPVSMCHRAHSIVEVYYLAQEVETVWLVVTAHSKKSLCLVFREITSNHPQSF